MDDPKADQPDVVRALPAPAQFAVQPASAFAPELEPADEEKPPDFRRMASAFARHKWLVLLVTLVGAAGGFVASRFVPPKYLAQATLWIETSQARGDGRETGPIQADQLLQWSSWVDLLQSFVVLDEVVRRRQLYLVARLPADSALFDGFSLKSSFVPGDYTLSVSRDGRSFSLQTGDREVQTGAVGDSVGNAMGFQWVPRAGLRPGGEVRFLVRTPRDAALELKKDLKATSPQQGNFLRLELEGDAPATTAATLNAMGDRFVEVAADLKRQKLSELSKILDQQLTSSYQDLGRAENSLETFRVHTITLPSDQSAPVAPGLEQTRDPVFKSFFDLRIQRDQLDRDRGNILSALAQRDSSIATMQLEGIEAVRGSSELSAALNQLATKQADARAMRLQFGGAYPPLHQTEQEIADLRLHTIPDLARRLASELETRVRDLDARIGSASRDLQQIPQRAIEEARLRRNVTIAENLYTTLQQRYEEARLAEVSSIPDVRVLDRAVPPDKPEMNRAIMVMLGGVFGGLAGGFGLALLLDRFDRRVRYPEQVSLGLGLQLLGVIPHLPKNGAAKGEAQTQVIEALRAVRLNVEHAYGTAGPLVTTVTSTERGDGKSFLASNLAVSFADAGRRVIVIDADIRRGELHTVFDVSRKPGLIDFLTGRSALDDIVHKTGIKGIHFIASGTRRTAGPELLASAMMSRMLLGLRGNYDVIIVDSPPLGAGVDPLILSTLTGNMVLVLRAGVTDRDYAKAKLDHIGTLPIRMLGAVINDVRDSASHAYYSYYGYHYLPGYAVEEEDAEEGVKVEAVVKRLPGKRTT